jgi:3-methyl-2-oxobutanoate hydroxymethyltransferase
MGQGHVPGFVKKYADLKPLIQNALTEYKADVESGGFPEQ